MSQEAPIKYFTLEEANSALPYVRRVVEDIVAEYEQWRDRISQYEMLAASATVQDGEVPEQVALREEVDVIAKRINALMEELASVGCVFKGFEGGLVDFYTKFPDRDALLCWKLGESEVAFWHEVDEGFAGRKALTPELVEGVHD
jgi:hypothetical protein